MKNKYIETIEKAESALSKSSVNGEARAHLEIEVELLRQQKIANLLKIVEAKSGLPIYLMEAAHEELIGLLEGEFPDAKDRGAVPFPTEEALAAELDAADGNAHLLARFIEARKDELRYQPRPWVDPAIAVERQRLVEDFLRSAEWGLATTSWRLWNQNSYPEAVIVEKLDSEDLTVLENLVRALENEIALLRDPDCKAHWPSENPQEVAMLSKVLREGLREANKKCARLLSNPGRMFTEEKLQKAFSLSAGNSAALDGLTADIRRELEIAGGSDSQEDREYKLLLYRYQKSARKASVAIKREARLALNEERLKGSERYRKQFSQAEELWISGREAPEPVEDAEWQREVETLRKQLEGHSLKNFLGEVSS